MSLGQIIRQRREELKLTLDEVANRIGFSARKLARGDVGTEVQFLDSSQHSLTGFLAHLRTSIQHPGNRADTHTSPAGDVSNCRQGQLLSFRGNGSI